MTRLRDVAEDDSTQRGPHEPPEGTGREPASENLKDERHGPGLGQPITGIGPDGGDLADWRPGRDRE